MAVEERVMTFLHAYPGRRMPEVAGGLGLTVADAIVTMQRLHLRGLIAHDGSNAGRWRVATAWDPDVELTSDGAAPTWPKERGSLKGAGVRFYLEVEIDPADVGFIDMAEWLREVRDKASELGRVIVAEMREVPETVSVERGGAG